MISKMSLSAGIGGVWYLSQLCSSEAVSRDSVLNAIDLYRVDLVVVRFIGAIHMLLGFVHAVSDDFSHLFSPFDSNWYTDTTIP